MFRSWLVCLSVTAALPVHADIENFIEGSGHAISGALNEPEDYRVPEGSQLWISNRLLGLRAYGEGYAYHLAFDVFNGEHYDVELSLGREIDYLSENSFLATKVLPFSFRENEEIGQDQQVRISPAEVKFVTFAQAAGDSKWVASVKAFVPGYGIAYHQTKEGFVRGISFGGELKGGLTASDFDILLGVRYEAISDGFENLSPEAEELNAYAELAFRVSQRLRAQLVVAHSEFNFDGPDSAPVSESEDSITVGVVYVSSKDQHDPRTRFLAD